MKRMKKLELFSIIVLTLITVITLSAQNSLPSAKAILAKVDNNEVYKSITYDGEMIIEYKGKRFIKTFKGFAREDKDTFIEFINSQDRGTKYLKKGGRLYVYSPDTEQIMLISGHLLKESMMGSDLSYEDTIENRTLSARYTPAISSTETIDGRQAWVLDLTAIEKTESYPKRRLWVAKDNYDVLRYELFALSGAKLKEYKLIRSEKIGNRSFPVKSQISDLLRKNSRTIFIMRNIILDKPVSNSIFTTRNLQR